MKKSFKKTISYLLILCLLMQTCFVGFAFGETASVNQQIDIAGTKIDVNQDLRENADGTYTLSIELASEINRVAKSENNNVSRNEYFTAKVAGKYLIELWGGDGADGSNTSYGQGGKGGLGGHVYGVVDLEVGQTLYYVIGGDGVQTVATDDGGGVNGDGGHHGDIGSVAVGGGGGYSAVFLFDQGEFEAKYLDENGQMKSDNIDEDDRTSKYIMIAAGGGGGGGGNGFSFGGTQSGRADGGAGGSIGNTSGVLENSNGIEYDVEGTFYAGENGKSSGTSYEYIGHGATNNPGAIADTFTTLLKGKQPNDWRGSYNRNFLGGGGGGGNFRGGAGGAGFCGGSGGIQTSILIPTNVGGGGGGSSFMAKIVEPAPAGFVPEHAKNDSTHGGMVSIEFLGTTTDLVLNDLNLSLDVSKYFDITGVTEGGINKAHTLAGQTLSVSDIDLGTNGEPKTIEITFKPKEGFAGGNDVPLFNDDKFTCSHDGDSAVVVPEAKTAYVNVPLNFDIITDSYSYNEKQTGFEVANLYKSYGATHNELRQDFKSDDRYEFIDDISEIVVKDSTSTTVSGKINIQETTQFDVSYTVKLKTAGEAVVGKKNPIETIISKKAVVSIFGTNETILNGVNLKYSKLLSYTDGKYMLSLNVEGTASNSTVVATKPNPQSFDYNKSNSSNTYEYRVEKDGYYLIQAWGGNGGKGQDGWFAVSISGGNGGAGGYVSGYIYLKANQIVTVGLGSNGAAGDGGQWGDRESGEGGKYTWVKIDGSYVIIAPGGGGGERAYLDGATAGKNGEQIIPGSNVTLNTSQPSSVTDAIYSGQPGADSGAAAGSWFKLNTMDVSQSNNVLLDTNKTYGSVNDYTNNGGGAVHIKCLQLDESGKDDTTAKNELKAKLSKYNLNTQISQYFDIKNVTFEGVDSTNSPVVNDYASSDIINLTNINPTFTTNSVSNTDGSKTHTYSFDYTVNIQLTPKEGFLGGNDVPILVYNDAKYATGMQISQDITSSDIYNVAKKNETDFANVEIPVEIQNSNLLTHDQTYVLGCEGISKSALYTLSSDVNDLLNTSYTGDDAWKAAFVTFVEPASDLSEKLTPQETTTYTISAGIRPNKAAEKAIVVESVESKVVSKPATIYVNYNATYNLTNMTTSDTPYAGDIYAVDPNTAYEVTLSPESGYLLPETITVTIGGAVVDSSKYTYDNKTGKLTIHKESITGNIVITATGEIVTYSLNFIYEIRPGFGQYTKTEKYPAGTAIDAGATFAGTYVPPAYDGYTFIWNWATDDGNPITQMPAQNWWITGQYVANDYNLTINYYKGSELHSTHTETIKYGNEYNITSPTISGYVPDKTVVEGTMPARDVTIDVNYTATANQLNIIYIMADTNEEVDRYVGSYDTDATYSVATPVINGYTADIKTVSGTMTAEGKVVYVRYIPNKYTVTFNPDGGNMIESQKTKVVAYNNTYGYDVSTGEYTPLPEPVKVGYTFEGWYLGGQKVTEETKVTVIGEHSLVAKWKSEQYTVTVKYVYEDGTKALDDYSKSFDYNTAYDVKSPSIEGYTPDVDRVQGTIGAQNVVVTVKYVANEYKLTVKYLNAQNNNQISAPVTQTVAYKDSYSITSPTVTGYTASITTVEGIMPAEDKTITVYYYKNAPTINVTVEWGDLTFEYERGDWDPDTLQYGEDVITPTSAGNNTVTVTNKNTSTVSVIADLKYTGDAQYRNLGGYFTANNNKADAKISETTVAKGSQKTSYLWLEGDLERDVTGTITSGTCEVTIRGGN